MPNRVGSRSRAGRRRQRRLLFWLALIHVVLPPLLLGYTFLEARWLTVSRHTFAHPRIPDGFEGFRLVFLADIHHGPNFSRERVASLVRRVNALEPDLIVLGGDYVHRHPDYIEPVFKELAALRAPHGVHGVLGNHDHWESAPRTRAAMASAGIGILDNNAVWVERDGDRIRLGGVGDLWEDTPNLAPTLDGVSADDLVVLLCHEPDFAERLEDDRIDLLLAGHTHGGQVTVLGLWAPVLPTRYGNKYRSGWVQTEHTTVFITRGVGTISPPVRFFCRPEIVVLELRRSAA